ncbi:MAG: zinc-ribbon domain-containing protein [Pseudomonadales bacterium]|nr:zinc-ribbon domain-containing protein [Pseudomonadales bacterium]
MSEQLLTKCPHCATTFRLSQQQLEIAGGAVRCGACY